MAAHGNFIRVRLYFDYPPPAVVDCRMCWLLVDLNKCRVVADLESIIREKFEFSRGNILNLFIEDCYLPHTESIYVVRDNDSVRVKVDCLTQVNGHSSRPDTSNEICRKRQRPTEEAGPGENGVNVEWKKKKRKKTNEESVEGGAKQTSGDERNKKSLGNKMEKKKRKKAEENGPTATPKPAASTKKTPASVEQPVKSTRKPPVAQAKTPNSSSSDSSSEEDEVPKKTAPKKTAAPKPATKTPSTPAAPKALPNTKPAPKKKLNPPSSSSSETDSSSDEAASVKIPPKTKPLSSATPKLRGSDNSNSQQSTNCAEKPVPGVAAPPRDKVVEQPEPCNTNDEEEIELIIRRPVQQPGHGVGYQSSWRGHGRGRAIPAGGFGGGGPGGRGRSEGRGGFRGFSYDGAKQPSYQTDSMTNISVVLQNRVESAPKQDYSSMPLLAAPPQVGQKIAFKLLELTENYTPEVSEYKEAKIVNFDPTTKQIELKLFNASRAPVEPGKFDLVYQNADGSETVEYAVSRESCVTERWDSLLEPRLII